MRPGSLLALPPLRAVPRVRPNRSSWLLPFVCAAIAGYCPSCAPHSVKAGRGVEGGGRVGWRPRLPGRLRLRGWSAGNTRSDVATAAPVPFSASVSFVPSQFPFHTACAFCLAVPHGLFSVCLVLLFFSLCRRRCRWWLDGTAPVVALLRW